MAMLLVLLDGPGERPDVTPLRLHQLSDLGVTDLAILRGEAITAVLLEGWALEPTESAAQASEIVAGSTSRRVLLPILQASVTHPAPAAASQLATSSGLVDRRVPTGRSRP